MQFRLNFLLIIFSGVLLTSCGASRSKVITTKTESATRIEPANKQVQNIISHALEFEGTRYKYGGTTKKGMDCSGLIYTSFLKEDIPLPRTSRDLSLKGQRLYLKEVSPGDLLFFETNKKRKVINHVGLVVEVADEILFIHSSTSRGVIISSLENNYWKTNFVMARRIL
ncbi:C40 family peptidase [Salegentibacter sediminis]|uniref:C40 family peptidase n=1 Tax=Salegentibacter sediminis TaxID=1930251 RepID=UPI0009C04F92|nr:C40 family peptidase [Salegentibacter sediminis]